MGLGSLAKKWLGEVFRKSSPDYEPSSRPLTGPASIVAPMPDATLVEHIDFLLRAKRFVSDHPVPDEFKTFNNQYSHAGKPLIGNDRSRPAITNCSYLHFGRHMVSVGWPLFIEQSPFVVDNKYFPAFHAAAVWDSLNKLFTHVAGDLGEGDTKFGYYRPTNHYYIEMPTSQEVHDKLQPVIDLYTHTDITDARLFLRALNRLSPLPDAPRADPA